MCVETFVLFRPTLFNLEKSFDVIYSTRLDLIWNHHLMHNIQHKKELFIKLGEKLCDSSRLD